MNKYKTYIKKRFSDELNLLIYLSQDEVNLSLFHIDLSLIHWDEFVRLTIKHRLVSHVLKHSKFLAENIPIPTYEKLIAIRLERSKKALNFAIHAIRIYQKFKENNILHCFFKGPLLSLDLYGDIGYRNFKDIDILVEKKNIEKARDIIEELDFKCIYPANKLTEKQKRINYTISHHYHFIHPIQEVEVELHWNISNPKSYFSRATKEIISNSNKLQVSTYELPYISKIENIVYQAAHGSIHQWYRLFWLKDFSFLLSKTNLKELKDAFDLSKKLKLERTFIQACKLAHLIYETKLSDFSMLEIKCSSIYTPLNSISSTDLNQKGIRGKLKFVFYRLNLKPDFNYYFELIFRLRTYLLDWELIKLNDSFFFMYYLLRPFLLIYRFLLRK